VYGSHVQIQTDHKPLLAIHKKALSSAPRRSQRMMLRLQRYDYTLNYRPGSQMILADTLSRAYTAAQTEEMSFNETLASLSSVDSEQMSEVRLVASDKTIKRSVTAASGDNEYTELLRQIAAGWPESPSDLPPNLRAYHTFSEELSSSNGLVFKGHRLVVPLPMRAGILDRLHATHTGVNGCLRRARESLLAWCHCRHQTPC